MSVSVTTIRLFLHLLSVSVWVGGQIVLVALVPVARRAGPDLPRLIARRFTALAWPFFGLAVLTGVWNLALAHPGDRSASWNIALGIKLLAVAASGIAALIHSGTPNRVARAVTGAGSLLAGLAALFLGVLLTTN